MADLANMMPVCPVVLVGMALKCLQHFQIYTEESDTSDFKSNAVYIILICYHFIMAPEIY